MTSVLIGAMAHDVTDTVAAGSLVVAIPIAVVAGLLSFASPCVVPLLPGYLSYMTGVAVQDLETAKRGRMLAGSALFVLGFTVLFVSGGALFGGVGARLVEYQAVISRVLGVAVILFGLAFIGRIPLMQREIRLPLPGVGLAMAPLLGLLFGLGWVPCLSPTLGTVTTLAYTEATAGRGALLAFAYCVGLGLPFILVAVAFGRLTHALAWLRRHQRGLTLFGGALMIALGILLAASGETAPEFAVPELTGREFGRWAWRQLTSMRTALLLLLLLALVAIPGSVLPQASVDARAVEAYRLQHPDLAPWLDRLGLFHMYTSVWFSAVYLLLMASLIGCIVPRTLTYARAFAARPPKAPANFSRMPASAVVEVDASSDVVVDRARAALRRARVDVAERDGYVELSAESGRLREIGNLLFHIAVVGVLVGVAVGALYGYRGSAVVTEGDGFSNVLTQYDDFSSGALFDAEKLPPFAFHVGAVDARFQLTGPQRGAPRFFAARGTWSAGTGEQREKPFAIRVNHPLQIGGTSVFLVGQGYAPVFKVTDAEGDVVFEDAVPFLPSDGTYTSSGVVKVPDAQPEGLGFQGFFLPTAITTDKGEAPISAFPAAANPFVGLFVFHGDLGLDSGRPQSVFALDKTKLKQFKNRDGTPYRVSLNPGQVADLPGGGSIEFVELRQFARLQIGSSPLAWLPLGATILGVAGLVLSLLIRPRRTWLRIRAASDGGDSRTVVEIAALDRIGRGGGDLASHVGRVVDAIEEGP